MISMITIYVEVTLIAVTTCAVYFSYLYCCGLRLYTLTLRNVLPYVPISLSRYHGYVSCTYVRQTM